MLIIRADAPKRPVSKGKRGCEIGRFNVEKPRIPDRRNIINPSQILSSLRIRKKEMKIKMNGRIVFMDSNMKGIEIIKIGVKMRIINKAVSEP